MIDTQLFLQPQLACHRNSTLSKLQKAFLGLSAYPTENSLSMPIVLIANWVLSHWLP